MTIIEALISGLVQGLTEFLPVSSSGHLVLVHSLFGYKEPTLFFDICLHVGTLLSVLVFFGKYIINAISKKDLKLLTYVAISTIPAVGAALLFEDKIEGAFSNPGRVSICLIITGIVLFIAHFSQLKRKMPRREVSLRSSIFMGLSQAFALLPGISRSGSTISAGLLSGVKEEEAFRFSFMMSIPVILGALVFKLKDFEGMGELASNTTIYVLGTLTAFIIGLASLFCLWKVLKVKRLYIFGIYCVVLGIVGIFYF